ncbi:phosphotransferase family protein [Streptacidiphilus sp. P02-A3a]|uniref:phosphotransferase family protein n=1 Tax=Streptacidiphilus sp. P02-A3a TaxID=2704468 RepID=UPI0015FDE68F|nr:aminoglycoside phosphotransferase family protein [Streptacidiphilus sp. P02-A3a]QMU69774.1 aminoglycoside phosphotransferase family protein [Streptacidiphilus sp. P02-A3a]
MKPPLPPAQPPRAAPRSSPLLVQWELAETGAGVAHDLAAPGRARELTVLRYLSQRLPVPRPLGRLTLSGQQYAVYSRIGDRDLQEVLPTGGSTPPLPPGTEPRGAVEPAALDALPEQLGRLLAELHRVPAPADGPEWHGDPGFRLLTDARAGEAASHTERELDRALRRAAEHGLATARQQAAARRALESAEGSGPHALGFVHFDPHPRNVRIATRDGRPSLAGLIDFKNAQYWYPEFDLVVADWHLAAAPAAAARFRSAYETARGARTDPRLLRLCETVRLAFVLANAPNRDPAWIAWCAERWQTLADGADRSQDRADGGHGQ